ncbi:MAG: DUF4256 domain-containing protein [Crocinitomicaceae bacterium]|nr:DUF4256 domain-containing protein [Crocinitomicaceae bacterium]
MAKSKNAVSDKESKEILQILKTRFEKNNARHKSSDWKKIEAKLLKQPDKLWSLIQMEQTGGEPDVIGEDKKTGEIIFCDCSPETPKGRVSLCYDEEALNARKENKPAGSAMKKAADMGIEMLDETQYRDLQKLGKFDAKTSSWLKTPADIRKLGGAIFGDWRYGHTFIYHNGAQSYYAARGFRGLLKV